MKQIEPHTGLVVISPRNKSARPHGANNGIDNEPWTDRSVVAAGKPKVYDAINEHPETPDLGPLAITQTPNKSVVEFHAMACAVPESVGKFSATVIRTGKLDNQVAVRYVRPPFIMNHLRFDEESKLKLFCLAGRCQ